MISDEAEERLNQKIDAMRSDVCGHLHEIPTLKTRMFNLETKMTGVETKVDGVVVETQEQTKMLRSLDRASKRLFNSPIARGLGGAAILVMTALGGWLGASKANAETPSQPTLTSYERELAACGASTACADLVRERHSRK